MRTARAEYILPVPMGSPQNYLGVGRLVKNVEGPTAADDWETPDATGDPSDWYERQCLSVNSEQQQPRRRRTASDSAAWRDFEIDIPTDAEIKGIEVEIEARRSGSGSCRIGVEISAQADQDDDWTNTGFTVPATWQPDRVGRHLSRRWEEPQSYGARLGRRPRSRTTTSASGSAARMSAVRCTVEVDRIRIRIHYATSSEQEVPGSQSRRCGARAPELLGRHAEPGCAVDPGRCLPDEVHDADVGDQPQLLPWPQACSSNPEGFYNYAIELPAGGNVWLFDPGFCDGTGSAGTGEYWTIGGSNGASTPVAVSAFYRLYNTVNTAWDFNDDVRVDGQSGTAVGDGDIQPNSFRRGVNNNGVRYYDSTLRDEPSSGAYTDCDGLSWHHDWWQIGFNLGPGIYRLHTSSHDRILANDQNNATGLNSFAIYASGPGGAVNNVKVYGLGAMEAYFPLPAGQPSTFYLAQIEAVHANKWVDITLWDPGDTGGLSANLEVLMPKIPGGTMPTGVPNCGNASYCPVPFHFNAVTGTTIPTDFTCGPETSGTVTSIQTSAGSGGIYNGRWLRLCFQLPENWTAPVPTPDGLTPTGGQGGGWFRIRYNMGSGSQPSTDLTTWTVEVRGNPVHLITPTEDLPTP